MFKQDYIVYLDRMIKDMKEYDYCDYSYTLSQLSLEIENGDEVIKYDILRRRLGLNEFYGTGELEVIERDYTSTLNLERFKIYKNNLLYLGEVEFTSDSFDNKLMINDKETGYEITEYHEYKVESPEIRNNSNLFFDINNKKLITLEGKDFAEYTEN